MVMPRTIVVGDIHGCIAELEALVKLVEYRPGKDRLVLLGDLIDRGPSPRECIQWAMKNHVVACKGNHEAKCVDFRRKAARARAGGPPNTMRSPFPKMLEEWNSFSDEELAWMDSLPLWVDLGDNWLAVHAGFEPRPLEEQKVDRVTRIRWVDEKTGEFVGMKQIPSEEVLVEPSDKPHVSGSRPLTPEAIALRQKRQQERLARGQAVNAAPARRTRRRYVTTHEQPDHTLPWQKAWPGPQNVIHGHDAQRDGKVLVEECASGVRILGIDTGCVFGLCLTAAIFSVGSPEFVSVPAREQYYQWNTPLIPSK